MRAALAFFAAGDLLQAIGYGAEGMRLQNLAIGWQVFFLWGIFSLGDEPLHKISDLIELGEVLALKGPADGLGYQQDGLM